jgi:peptidoglycan/xylan/chitin deacetylase (PgdA/CDA1 family)/DNA-binding XRE family transcriptional regulator
VTDSESGVMLRQWRERAGMTQSALASAMGIDANTIDRWEWGEALPTPEQANILAAVLGLPPDLLTTASATDSTVSEIDEPAEISIELLAPASTDAARGAAATRLDGFKQNATAAWGEARSSLRELGADRPRRNMVLGLAGAVLFFLLAAVGFSQADDARDEAAALRETLASTASTALGLETERDDLAARLSDVEGSVEAAEERAEEAEAAARVQWEPLIAENERLAAENRFLRKVLVVSSAAGNVAGVGLTFDGDPTPDALAGVLDLLAEERVSATFFASGVALQANPEGWARALAEGHEIGNATYSRNPIDPDALDLTAEEIEAWQEVARDVAGEDYRTPWFRPPLLAGFEDGVGTQAIRKVIAQRGMITALWSVETFYALFSPSGPQAGGPDPDADAVAAYVVGESSGGDILLLQFGSLDIEATPAIIGGLRDKGLAPLSLTNLFAEQQDLFEGDLGVGGA